MKQTPLIRRTPLARGPSTLRRSGRIQPKPRSASEFRRIYGSKHRVRWVKQQPCVCCDADPQRTPSQNAHTETGGMGRKADSTTIVPLCAQHHDDFHHGRLGRSREWWREQARLTALAYDLHLEGTTR